MTTMINTGDVGVIRDGVLVRQIQTYYATVDKVLSFEDALEINRVKLVDAQQQAGLSPVDATPADEMATIFGRVPATARGGEELLALYEPALEADEGTAQ